MNRFTTWIKSNALTARAVRTFVFTFVGVILFNWYAGSGPDQHHITGLWDSIRTQWDAAAGTALIATLGTLGWAGLLQRDTGDQQLAGVK